jgi:hypothetical protein
MGARPGTREIIGTSLKQPFLGMAEASGLG